jgi:hypothetical protein
MLFSPLKDDAYEESTNATIRENFRGEISPMGYFSMLFSKKRFANLPFLKPHFAQF